MGSDSTTSFDDSMSDRPKDEKYEATGMPNGAADAKDEERLEPENEKKDLEKGPTYVPAFSPQLRPRWKSTIIKYLINYLIISSFMLSVFSIYWGASYKKLDRIKNLKMLVVIEDDKEINNVQPFIGDSIEKLLRTPQGKGLGTWDIYHSADFEKIAKSHNNNTVEQEINRQIHHQKYWTSIWVKPNASYNLHEAIVNGDTSYNVTNSSILSIYETARDILSMGSYIVSSVKEIEAMWLTQENNVTTGLVSNIDNLSANSLKVLATPIAFRYIDRIPFTNPVITAPAQVGLIYIVIITFVQASFFMELHKQVATFGMRPRSFLIYRWCAAILSFFIVSCFFSLVSLALQIDFTKAFGHSGFLVYWMTSFLTMCAVGLANEVMAMVCVMIFPPGMGLWLLFWVIINISPTFTPLALAAKFYRYGYALPIHNAFEVYKVIFFNTWKGNLGRSFGIIVAWVVIMSILLPIVTYQFNKVMRRRAIAAMQQQKN